MKLQSLPSVDRFQVVKVVLIVIGLVFIGRLFSVQVVHSSTYKAKAASSQQKSVELDPVRGQIYFKDGDDTLPLVLNETFMKIIADPRYVDNPQETAFTLAQLTGGDPREYEEKLSSDSAYKVLEEFVSLDVAEQIKEQRLRGIALRDTTKRVYPEGNLAAHVTGFVNADGEGQYGVEQYFDESLRGETGYVKGAFDVRGIPIAIAENVEKQPVNGQDIVLTIDRNVQKAVETILQERVDNTNARSGSAVVIDPQTGEIRAMANYPTFNPEDYRNTEDISVFTNKAISEPFEAGSVIKVFAMALGLDTGVVTPDTTYQDNSCEKVDRFTICNAGGRVRKTRTMTEVITRSANTGVMYVLKNLAGNRSDIDREDKEVLYSFYTEALGFGKHTNIELANEQPGVIDTPDASDARYANMTFGQGFTTNMVQLGAGISAMVNGGTYYQPTIIDKTISPDGEVTDLVATVARSNIVSEQTSRDIKAMMETVVSSGGGFSAFRSGYAVGGKTGTAQLPSPDGGYYDDRDIGTFVGFGTSDQPQYVVVVRIDEPQVSGFAGSVAAAPMFAEISNWLINYYGVAPNGVE